MKHLVHYNIADRVSRRVLSQAGAKLSTKVHRRVLSDVSKNVLTKVYHQAWSQIVYLLIDQIDGKDIVVRQ